MTNGEDQGFSVLYDRYRAFMKEAASDEEDTDGVRSLAEFREIWNSLDESQRDHWRSSFCKGFSASVDEARHEISRIMTDSPRQHR